MWFIFGKNKLKVSQVAVFDLRGRQVHAVTLDFKENERQEISINTSAGVYIVNLIDEAGRKASKKIVIE